MTGKLTHFTISASVLIILLNLTSFLPVISYDLAPIPADLEYWISHNVHTFTSNATLESSVFTAENAVKIIKVRKDRSGDFKTVTGAVNSIAPGNTNRTIVWIGPGVYREKITIVRSKPFITFYGKKTEMPKLTYNGTAAKYGTINSATVAVESNYFMAANIIFENSAPIPDGKRVGAQAVAMRISGDKAAFYNCKFIGFQDTLCDDKGKHFFKDCYIAGTVDFIFGSGKSFYLQTEIHSVANDIGVITANGKEREDDDSGFVFVHCTISGTGNNYLGRAWMERAQVVFAYTYMGTIVNPKGWFDMGDPARDKTVFYGEYKCKGPGADTRKRVRYAKMLTDEEAKPFLDLNFINAATWLLLPPNL